MDTELKGVIETLGKTFEEFKQANAARVEKLEKGLANSDLEEKVDKINADLGEIANLKQQIERLETHAARPPMDGKLEGRTEYYKAFANWMKSGDEAPLRDIQMQRKDLDTGVDTTGGHGVPEELDTMIHMMLPNLSPIRTIAQVKTVSSDYKKLVSPGGWASGWVGEEDARTKTTTGTLQGLTPPQGEIYANPAATQVSIDDIIGNPEAWVRDEIVRAFATAEGAAFCAGNGTDKPKGFTAYTTAATADAARAFGTMQHVATGVSANWTATNPHLKLIDLLYALKAGYRQNATWVMSGLTMAGVRKMMDGDGDLIWRPGLIADQPDTLLGKPVLEADDMPAIAANSLSVAVGDFGVGYQVVDRMGTRMIRDEVTNKPYIQFYTTKRVSGHVIDSAAIKLLKFGTS